MLLLQFFGIVLHKPGMGVEKGLAKLRRPFSVAPKLLAVIDDHKPGELLAHDTDADLERSVRHDAPFPNRNRLVDREAGDSRKTKGESHR